MPESVLTILKFCFLALLYLFLYRVVRVVVSEMRVRPSPPAPVAQPTVAASARTEKVRGRAPSRVRILEPPPRRGETFTLGDERTVGRGGGCGIVLDDGFVSQVHARFYLRDGNVYLEEISRRLNGTLVNGQPLQGTLRLKRGDRVQFGHTIAEAVR